MDSTAINAIRDLVNAELTNNLLKKDNSEKNSPILLPEGYTLFSVEKYQLKPSQFRGAYTTSSFMDFLDYVHNNKDADSKVFIDPDKYTATAILDIGNVKDPKWGKHVAKLSLKKTAEFSAITDKARMQFNQIEFVDFIEDFSENIIFEGGLSQAILAVRNMSVSTKSEKDSTVGDFKSTASKYDEIEVKSKGNVLPEGFTFSCVPFVGFEPITIDCRLRAVTNGDKVSLVYRIMRQEMIFKDISEKFKDALEESLGDGVYLGDMAYQ